MPEKLDWHTDLGGDFPILGKQTMRCPKNRT